MQPAIPVRFGICLQDTWPKLRKPAARQSAIAPKVLGSVLHRDRLDHCALLLKGGKLIRRLGHKVTLLPGTSRSRSWRHRAGDVVAQRVGVKVGQISQADRVADRKHSVR